MERCRAYIARRYGTRSVGNPCGEPLRGGSVGGEAKTGNLILKRENHQNTLYNSMALKKNIDLVVYLGEREGSLKATDDV